MWPGAPRLLCPVDKMAVGKVQPCDSLDRTLKHLEGTGDATVNKQEVVCMEVIPLGQDLTVEMALSKDGHTFF